MEVPVQVLPDSGQGTSSSQPEPRHERLEVTLEDLAL